MDSIIKRICTSENGCRATQRLAIVSTTQVAELSILDEKLGWIGSDCQGEGAGKLMISGPAEMLPRRRYRIVENETDWNMDDKEISTWRKMVCGGFTDDQMRFHECSLRRVRAGKLSNDKDP